MPVIFVAASKALSEWGHDIGLTKHVYKLAVADDAEAAVAAMNAAGHAGQKDWKAIRKRKAEAADEAALIATLAKKEKLLDPAFYPRLAGAGGVFKVKFANVEGGMVMQQALANQELKPPKPKPADIGEYMIRNALG